LGAKVCLFTKSKRGFVAYPASCSVDTRGLFLGVRWLMQEADHSPPSSAEGKNEWSYKPLLLYAFKACRGTA